MFVTRAVLLTSCSSPAPRIVSVMFCQQWTLLALSSVVLGVAASSPHASLPFPMVCHPQPSQWGLLVGGPQGAAGTSHRPGHAAEHQGNGLYLEDQWQMGLLKIFAQVDWENSLLVIRNRVPAKTTQSRENSWSYNVQFSGQLACCLSRDPSFKHWLALSLLNLWDLRSSQPWIKNI